MCERWVETGTDCYIDPSSPLDHSSISFSTGCLLNRGSWGPIPQSANWFSRWHSCQRLTNGCGHPVYSLSYRPPASTLLGLFTLVHLLTDGKVEGQYIIQVHLLRKQWLINQDRHQHATSKGIDSYDRLSVMWKSDLTDKIKSAVSSKQHVDTAIWMHYIYAN